MRKILLVAIGVLIIFSLIEIFTGFKPAKAIGEATITSPSNDTTLSGTAYLLQGRFIYSTPSQAIFKINGTPACGPILNPGMNFSCNFNTTLLSNGTYNLQLIVTYNSIDFFSNMMPVNILNTAGITTLPPQDSNTPTPVGEKSQTPVGITTLSPSPESTATAAPSPQTTLTTMPIPGRPDLSPIPVVETSEKTQNNNDLINISTVVNTIIFKLDQDKPLHIEKLEQRQTESKTNFLLFTGKSYSNSLVKMTIKSEPLVMSVEADANGNWNYILEDPLEPGTHEALVEVNHNNQIETSGPYPFNIAKAQATFNNPTGASLNIIDPQKQAMRNYLFLALGLLVVAILILLIFLYMKRLKRLKTAPNPVKESVGI